MPALRPESEGGRRNAQRSHRASLYPWHTTGRAPAEDMRIPTGRCVAKAGQSVNPMQIGKGDDLAGRRQDEPPGAAEVVLHQRPGVDAADQPQDEQVAAGGEDEDHAEQCQRR